MQLSVPQALSRQLKNLFESSSEFEIRLVGFCPASISLQLAMKTPWAIPQSQFTLCEKHHSRRQVAITISLS